MSVWFPGNRERREAKEGTAKDRERQKRKAEHRAFPRGEGGRVLGQGGAWQGEEQSQTG